MSVKKGLGIKKKALLGCVILGLILLFSSVISIYEFMKMNKYVADVITENIKSIDSARGLLNAAENHNLTLMASLDEESFATERENDRGIASQFVEIGELFTTPQEKLAADSVMIAYAAYMQVASEAERMWEFDSIARRDWFFNRLQPVYLKFRDYLSALTIVCEDTLISNSQSLQNNYHRSIMPAFISLILSLILVLLFNYYLNAYLINPLLKVNRNIKSYRQFGKKYELKIDSDDEIAELNDNVKDLIDLNQSYKKHLEKK